jgi:hypothetical protein
MIAAAVKLIDPRTKQATAYYTALGITVFDIARHGFQPMSTLLLAALAGLGTLGILGTITKQPPAE